MTDKRKRLEKVVAYLIWKDEVSIQSPQKDIATKIGASKVTISNAIKGNVRYLTDSLLLRINEYFGSPFNKEWLLTGDGEMLKTNTQENNVATNGGIVGIQGSGHQITNNDIAGIIELQKGYQDMIKKSQEQIDKLIEIIKNYESWKKE
ncbi:hypothetical protein Barb6XT_03178 [Bacteroidales bacterium Barb6XT]|nr:hypothetical protein Barb6XT_03178 [Bacteroidales bacterium Barb6XT]